MKAKVERYLRILGSLFLLLALTTGVAFLPLGSWNWLPAVIIAFIMTAFIMLFFMRLQRSEPLLWLTSVSGFIWLSLLLLLVVLDYVSRPWPR
jgi:caa(3)-type oxidase subunit IV